MNEIINIESIKTIESRIERIEILHKSILSMAIRSFEFGVMIGAELSEQKKLLPHGQFIKWIEENLPYISRMTANRYIRVYENQDTLREQLGAKLELKKAYTLLTKKNEMTVNPKSKIEKAKMSIDFHLMDSIQNTRKRISLAKRKILKGEKIPKSEIRLLENYTREKREKVLNSIEKQKEKLRKLEEILDRL